MILLFKWMNNISIPIKVMYFNKQQKLFIKVNFNVSKLSKNKKLYKISGQVNEIWKYFFIDDTIRFYSIAGFC